MAIKLKDKVDAQLKYSLSVDLEGNITGSTQKVLVDEDTKESVNDGDAQPLTLSTDEATALNSVIDAKLTEIFDARDAAATAVAVTPGE